MAQTLEGKGAAIGPMDVDSAGELTKRLGVHNKATRLLQRHAAQWPQDLRTALALPIDEERTKALDMDEVEDALLSLSGRQAFYKDDFELEDAAVRGTDRRRVVSVVYRTPSGRAAYGAIPYEGLEQSARNFEQAQAEEKGGVPVSLESYELGEGVDQAQLAALEQAARDAEQAAREAKAREDAANEELERLRDPEPWEGYDDANADDVKDQLKGQGAEYGRLGLERIADYEARHKNRSSVISAATDELDALAAADAE